MARISLRRKPDDSAAVEPETPVQVEPGKGRPTPSRSQRVAANKRPLVAADRKEAARASRERQQTERERARIGMANGEEKYLPVRDRGAQKRFVRDWMDARWSLGEAVLPLALIVVVSTALPATIAQYVLYGVWAYFIISIIDFVIVGQRLTKKLEAKFGADKVERIRFYCAMRGIYPRFMRMPKPQAKRGQFPS